LKDNLKIILGSKSPRRRELLTQMGYKFATEQIEIDETVESFIDVKDYVSQIAKRKGRIISNKHPDDLVICADTIVALGETIFEKPKDKEDARRMIKGLSGRSHDVFTAVFLKLGDIEKTFVVRTRVEIDNMTDAEIEAYVSTDEPYDKAGAYAIQGKFGKYIKGIHGDYYNVMGLPICRLNREIEKLFGD